MKDGYYLSVYTHISELACLLNIGLRDNHNMSLWKKEGSSVELVHYWEFERLSGYKQHKYSFYSIEQAKKVINKLLSQYNLSIDDMAEVIGTPCLETCGNYSTLEEFPDYTYHSMSHLFSSIMMDTKLFYNEDIIAISVDGGPDNVVDTNGRSKYFYSGAISRKGEIKVYPVSSPGTIWVFMKYRYSMQEGSLMALGSASRSEAFISIDECMKGQPPMQKFQDIILTYKWFNKIAERIEAITNNDKGTLFNYFDERFTLEENKISMVVKVFQAISIKMMEVNVQALLNEGNLDPTKSYLALSGGYALNCPTNTYLMEKYKFKGFIAPPCVSDTGISLGMGLYFFGKEEKIEFDLKNAYWGNQESEESIKVLLENDEFKPFIKSVTKPNIQQIVKDIIEQPIVWFEGRSEIGPRALGARSIFADPRNPRHKEFLNEVKQRQWWRPVAPIVLEECLEDWFELNYVSPYMLMALKMKEDKIPSAQAVVHLDNTARIQTIKNDKKSIVYDIVKEFFKETNVPIICNTSLNDKGEPIIDKANEALNFSLRKKIPIVYLNKLRIELKNFDKYTETEPAKRWNVFNYTLTEEEIKNRMDIVNPFGLSREQLILYLNNPELSSYDLKNDRDVKRLIRIFKHMPSMPF